MLKTNTNRNHNAFKMVNFSNINFPLQFTCFTVINKFFSINKGAVIKYGTEGGGRDLTGSPKLSDGNYWANKLLQMINMGHETICFWICFQYLQLF